MSDDSKPTSTTDQPLKHGLPDSFDELTRGAFDVHVHGQPDLSAQIHNRGSDVEVAKLAHHYGISGWVLKSHLWATMDRAAHIQEQLQGIDFTIFGSVTLNPVMGGLSSTVVELAAAHGARVVFLPTWGSRADIARGGYIGDRLKMIASSFDGFANTNALSLFDGRDRLSGAAIEVLDACNELGLSLATGHISLAESLAVAERCAETGQSVLISHPLHYVEHPRELRVFAELGAFIEFSNAPLLHPDGHLTIRDLHEAINEIGPKQVILSTDVFSRWVPPEPECLRIFAEQLAYLGWQPAQLREMLVTNPRRYLRLDAIVGS